MPSMLQFMVSQGFRHDLVTEQQQFFKKAKNLNRHFSREVMQVANKRMKKH